MENETKKPTPKPRTGYYYGSKIYAVDGANGTWLEGEEFAYPNGGMTRRAYVRCEDSQMRVVRCGIPDTYFSIPAYARVQGRRVKGFVTSSEDDGFKFVANKF
jgi:hypothetical protein